MLWNDDLGNSTYAISVHFLCFFSGVLLCISGTSFRICSIREVLLQIQCLGLGLCPGHTSSGVCAWDFTLDFEEWTSRNGQAMWSPLLGIHGIQALDNGRRVTGDLRSACRALLLVFKSFLWPRRAWWTSGMSLSVNYRGKPRGPQMSLSFER